jgi:hypothetical protein
MQHVSCRTESCCIVLYIGAIIAQFVFPSQFRIYIGIGILVLGLAALVSVVILAIRVYNPVTGIIFGIGTIIPCVGLLILLVVNNKATTILRQNGCHVGFFGANLSEF